MKATELSVDNCAYAQEAERESRYRERFGKEDDGTDEITKLGYYMTFRPDVPDQPIRTGKLRRAQLS